MPKSLDAESVLDSLVICVSLLSLSLQALCMVDDTADYVLQALNQSAAFCLVKYGSYEALLSDK